MNILRWRIYVKQESGDYEDSGQLFASFEEASGYAAGHFSHLSHRIVMTEIKGEK